MEELEYDDFGYAHTTGTDGHKYLHIRDLGCWRVAYSVEELEQGVEALCILPTDNQNCIIVPNAIDKDDYYPSEVIAITSDEILNHKELKVLICEKIVSYLPAKLSQHPNISMIIVVGFTSLFDGFNPMYVMHSLEVLRFLGIDQGLPKDFSYFPNLRFLEIETIRGGYIESVKPLRKLTTLRCRGVRNVNLPEGIESLENLTDLEFDGELKQFPTEVFDLPQLRVLDIPNNAITSLPPEIGQLTQLTELGLRGNRLTYLPPEIGQLTQLTTLDLRYNQLTSLPPDIGQLAQLQSLSLSGKDFSDLDCSLFVHLETLSFSASSFWLLPQNIHCLTNLRVLDLTECELRHVPQEVKSLQVEELILNLSRNPIPREEIETLLQERPGWEIEYW